MSVFNFFSGDTPEETKPAEEAKLTTAHAEEAKPEVKPAESK